MDEFPIDEELDTLIDKIRRGSTELNYDPELLSLAEEACVYMKEHPVTDRKAWAKRLAKELCDAEEKAE